MSIFTSDNKERRINTLCLVYRNDQILLGMKKRGFGAGRWNGFGGKIQSNETPEQAALRETREEAGIVPKKLEKRGTLFFNIETEKLEIEVHLFSASEFDGAPTETDEMKPQWFDIDKIPYDTMWPDDKLWLPLVLEGKNVRGEFMFWDTNTMLSHKIDFLGEKSGDKK